MNKVYRYLMHVHIFCGCFEVFEIKLYNIKLYSCMLYKGDSSTNVFVLVCITVRCEFISSFIVFIIRQVFMCYTSVDLNFKR